MNKYSISLQMLLENFGENLKHAKVKKDSDEALVLYNEGDHIACLDGEVCTVYGINEEKGTVLLINENGEYDVAFVLSKEEFGQATFV